MAALRRIAWLGPIVLVAVIILYPSYQSDAPTTVSREMEITITLAHILGGYALSIVLYSLSILTESKDVKKMGGVLPRIFTRTFWIRAWSVLIGAATTLGVAGTLYNLLSGRQ